MRALYRYLPLVNLLPAGYLLDFFVAMYLGAVPVVYNFEAMGIAVAGIVLALSLAASSVVAVLRPQRLLPLLFMNLSIAALVAINWLFWVQDIEWTRQIPDMAFPHNLTGIAVRIGAWTLWLLLNLLYWKSMRGAFFSSVAATRHGQSGTKESDAGV